MSKLPTIARLFLGLAFLVFGLNGFLQFLPMPPVTGAPAAFLGALAATGYMFPLIKGTEVIAGALLLGNRFVPLALALLAPVIVNIVAYHGLLAREGVGLPLLLLALEIFLAYAYRSAFAPMLAARAEPALAAPAAGVSVAPAE
ncbi:MAG: DoxX family protein [Polyangiales bacterium]|nr:DoxX family protein [Myxococcales bacterium]MCB9656608.1 DoxX family protein [Sandaracinaceae bacterium]